MNDSEGAALAAVRQWVGAVVVELNLCPFASRELDNNRVKFVTTGATCEEQLLGALEAELNYLDNNPDTETTLLIHPEVLGDFSDYNQFLDHVDALLQQLDKAGVYQVASFHPQYQFADTHSDDPENYTNRSPYPVLHILRESSVERAIDAHPDTQAIPERNIALLRDMGIEKLREVLATCAST